jgi:hypothetical protein
MRDRFEIYCEILSLGLIQIRHNAHDGEQCFAQADHLHNLPELLQNFDNEDLHCIYWEATRPAFISQSKLEFLGRFQQLWDELEDANRRHG